MNRFKMSRLYAPNICKTMQVIPQSTVTYQLSPHSTNS